DAEVQRPQNAAKSGEFVGDTTYIGDEFSAGLDAGAAPRGDALGELSGPVQAGRRRPVAARACPWAHGAVITRRLLGLEDACSLGLCGPTHDIRSWTFDLDPDHLDPVLGIPRLQDAYFNRIPDYPRGITVPAMVEIESKSV